MATTFLKKKKWILEVIMLLTLVGNIIIKCNSNLESLSELKVAGDSRPRLQIVNQFHITVYVCAI